MNKIDQELLDQIADMHSVPQGAYNIRKDGKLLARNTTEGIEIIPKKDKDGIDIIVHGSVKNESVHIPVIITQSGIEDLVYNDFYIEEGADVMIVAGCGIHNTGNKTSTHNGIHTFHLGKNCKVKYVEKHLGIGKNITPKILNPVTDIHMESGSEFVMETVQIGGVTSSKRVTKAVLLDGAKLGIQEKILTTEKQTATTEFHVELNGKDSSVDVVSRSVAKDNSYQAFNSEVIGNNRCFGHVACDGIIVGNSIIDGTPKISCRNVEATLIHEAAIGKIAGDQLTKLMTLGLSYEEAEDLIIKGFLS